MFKNYSMPCSREIVSPEVEPSNTWAISSTPSPWRKGAIQAGRSHHQEIDGQLQTHRFIRSDLFANPADAERFMVQKGLYLHRPDGERMFEPA